MTNRKPGLDAASLRILAMGLMLVDHMGAVLFPDELWMRIAGRLAFPIFAFQIAEGYRHTQDVGKYALRLLLFAVATEIPFNLMVSGRVFYPEHQNVLFTLLLGLIAVCQVDLLRTEQTIRRTLFRYCILVLTLLGGLLLMPDYGVLGILTVGVFYFTDGDTELRLAQTALLAAIHVYGYGGPTVSLFGGAAEFPLQGFALLSLIPIWMYSGEKGVWGKWLKYGCYCFYPAHMLILWMISQL